MKKTIRTASSAVRKYWKILSRIRSKPYDQDEINIHQTNQRPRTMKTLTALTMAFALATTLSAQVDPAAPSAPEDMTVLLSDSVGTLIGISPEQVDEWRELRKKYEMERTTLVKGNSFEQERENWVLRRDQAVMELLKPDQYDKWKALDPTVQGKLDSAPHKE